MNCCAVKSERCLEEKREDINQFLLSVFSPSLRTMTWWRVKWWTWLLSRLQGKHDFSTASGSMHHRNQAAPCRLLKPSVSVIQASPNLVAWMRMRFWCLWASFTTKLESPLCWVSVWSSDDLSRSDGKGELRIQNAGRWSSQTSRCINSRRRHRWQGQQGASSGAGDQCDLMHWRSSCSRCRNHLITSRF